MQPPLNPVTLRSRHPSLTIPPILAYIFYLSQPPKYRKTSIDPNPTRVEKQLHSISCRSGLDWEVQTNISNRRECMPCLQAASHVYSLCYLVQLSPAQPKGNRGVTDVMSQLRLYVELTWIRHGIGS